MTKEQMIAAAVAVVVLAWPKLVALAAKVKERAVAPPSPAVPTGVTFEAAIHNLAAVRARLLASSLLDETAKKAIDTLTLQLVAGSDK
jgi:hypothetical protein